MAVLPVTKSADAVRSLTPDTTTMIGAAAAADALANAVDPTPDASAIAGVLSRIPARDSAVIVKALDPQTRSAVQSASPRVCG